MKKFLFLSVLFITLWSQAQNVGNIDNQPATANKTTRLCLELVKTEPVPVIGPQHPDAKDIPAGFEAGTTVKVKINGQSRLPHGHIDHGNLRCHALGGHADRALDIRRRKPMETAQDSVPSGQKSRDGNVGVDRQPLLLFR